jgi:alcohol dehydrogenase
MRRMGRPASSGPWPRRRRADAAPIQVSPLQILLPSKTVHGHPSGTARDVEETLRFAALTGVRPLTETRPLERC